MTREPGALRLLAADGLLGSAVLVLALAAAATGIVLEAVLFRGLIELGRDLGLVEQRIGAVAALLLLGLGLLLLDSGLSVGVLRIGRRFELRLRLLLLTRLRGLDPQQHRDTGDIAQRTHSIHSVRNLAIFIANAVRIGCELLVTAAGMIWIHPAGAPLVAALMLLSLAVPLGLGRRLKAADMQCHASKGRLARFYLDAMMGLVPLRGHGAAEALQHEHQRELVHWLDRGWARLRVVLTIEALQGLGGFALTAWLLLGYLTPGREPAGMLLLVYWALNLPVLAQDLAGYLAAIPSVHNLVLRLQQALGPAATAQALALAPAPVAAPAVAVTLESVDVIVDGHPLLAGIDLDIAPGEHIAVVGPSGAGKSTLVGLLLGLVGTASGRVLVDGAPLDATRLQRLRSQTAWVDPGVQLWNRTLADNVTYGAPHNRPDHLAAVLAAADLEGLLESLPDGMQTRIGGGGSLLSGGEGQRVRLARAMLRADVRLVILDEPFRGLDRARRGELLGLARRRWRDATLVCVTHDVGETTGFERVLVVEGGQIVEDATPAELATRAGSRYRDLLDAERAALAALDGSAWRHLRLHDGRLTAEEHEGIHDHA